MSEETESERGQGQKVHFISSATDNKLSYKLFSVALLNLISCQNLARRDRVSSPQKVLSIIMVL